MASLGLDISPRTDMCSVWKEHHTQQVQYTNLPVRKHFSDTLSLQLFTLDRGTLGYINVN